MSGLETKEEREIEELKQFLQELEEDIENLAAEIDEKYALQLRVWRRKMALERTFRQDS